MFCLSVCYKITLKIREIESNIGVGSKNCKEKSRKMSVYSTKEKYGSMLLEICP